MEKEIYVESSKTNTTEHTTLENGPDKIINQNEEDVIPNDEDIAEVENEEIIEDESILDTEENISLDSMLVKKAYDKIIITKLTRVQI